MLAACAAMLIPGIAESEERPNIVWFSVEDISAIIGAYGAEGLETPNIDRMAEEGILYKNAYATVGVCAPSRSSIITGMYPVSIGTHNMRTGHHYGYLPPEEESYESYRSLYDQRGRNVPEYSAVLPWYVKCFTEYLRAEGYYTMNNDKTDYQFHVPITAWDESSGETHFSHAPEGMPFFYVRNDHVTHESRIWMKQNDPLLVDPEKVPIPAYFPDIPSVRKAVARKYSNIVEADNHLGDLMKELEEAGVLENTIIIFWSDHGGPLLRQKRAVGYSGLHVPLIVRFPDGYQAGTVVDEIVSLMDLGPTTLSLAGIQPPDYMHGKAFLGKYQSENFHPYAFGSADRFDNVYDMSRSVIDGRFVYIRNFRPELPLIYRLEYREQIEMTRELIEMDQRGELTGDAQYIFMRTKPKEELYDIVNDPHEINNLAEDTAHREKLLELRAALAQWQLEVGDLGFIPEYDLVQMMWPGLQQPDTEEVEFEYNNGKVQLNSPTQGASIAWQMENTPNPRHWNLYADPISVEPGQSIRARAVRIGFKTSPITTFTSGNRK